MPAAAQDVLKESFERDGWWVDDVPGDGLGWTDYRSSDAANNRIVEGYRGRGLRIAIPPYQRRGSGAHHLLPLGMEEGWFRYHLNLDSWQAADSGKLPGFADVGRVTARGCFRSTPSDPGWSARLMFAPPGTEGAAGSRIRLGYYTYHVDQPSACGEKMWWDHDAAVVGQSGWYCIEGHVKVNTPGVADGVLEAWVDGQRVFSRTDLQFRRATERHSVKLRSFWLDVYFGGSTIANTRTLAMRIDELVVRSDRRIGCLPRFGDTDGNVHRANIEALRRQGIVHGCAHDRYCPRRNLTRAAMLALLDRYLKPPRTSEDFFTDDDGHWAEAPINRLAALGVVRGCAEGRMCPDRPVTRGQIAAFLRRAFELPPADAPRFADVAGTTFERDIGAIAVTGITKGCTPTRFCPNDLTRRDQAASLFARAIEHAAG